MSKGTLLSVWPAIVLAGCGCSGGDYRTQPPDPKMLHAAVQDLTNVIVYDIFSPPQASRAYAYATIAAYEALRPDYASKYRSFAGQLNGLTPPPARSPDSQYYLPLSSELAYGLTARSFPSFHAAAAEAAISRLYGGIHYRQAIEEGVKQGRKVGELVLARVKTRTTVAKSPASSVTEAGGGTLAKLARH